MEDFLSALLAADKKPEKDVPLKRLGVTIRVKALDDKEIKHINERATFGKIVDEQKKALLMIEAATQFDWSDKRLLEKFDTTDPLTVIDRALLPGEKVKLINEILEVSGFDQDELIAKLKNS